MKKVLLKIYLEPQTKTTISELASKNKTSISKTARTLIEEHFDSIVFPEDEKRGCSVWKRVD